MILLMLACNHTVYFLVLQAFKVLKTPKQTTENLAAHSIYSSEQSKQ